jgi:uncharacterized coiled-coil DUF342 family protein
MEETVTQDKKEQIPVLQEPSISAVEFVRLRRSLNSLRERKEKIFEIRSVVSQEIKDLFSELKSLKEERDQMTEKVKHLKEEREKVNVSIKSKIGEVKDIKTSPGVPHINVTQLTAEIKKMQYFIETNPLSPDKEKEVMKTIKDKEKQIAKAKKVTEVIGQKKETSGKIDELKESSNKVHSEIQDTAAQSQIRHEKIISISKDIKFLKAREKDVHALFTQIKEEYKTQKLIFLQNKNFFSSKQRDQSHKEEKADREEKMLQKRKDEVEHKIKTKQKLTTEDLLAFRGNDKD